MCRRARSRLLAVVLLLFATCLAGCALFVWKADIAVAIVDAFTGLAIQDATVALDGQPGDVTGESGICQFRDVAIGSHVLHVSASGYDSYSEAVTVRGSSPQTFHIELRPDSLGEIHGIVTCKCGTGIPDIPIYLDGEQVATTDADGLYSFAASLGEHTVTAGSPSATDAASASVSVTAGVEQEVNLAILV
jgi:hypothetical protein